MSAKPATAAQVARNGQVAALLRAELDKRGWTPRRLNEAMGKPASHTASYVWLSAKGAPAPKLAARLAKVLGVAVERLQPNTGAPTQVASREPATATILAPKRAAEVLSFAVLDDGHARLRLDVVLPVTEAAPLLRLLLDAGIVMGAREAV
jgi:transcriptional regulator with XRE-family HTH domain